MQNQIRGIINKCFKKDRLTILTSPIHERFQSCLKDVPHDFWLVHVPRGKTWDDRYAKLPVNHTLVPRERGIYIPVDKEIDLVLSQNKFDAYQTLAPIARQLKVPLISLEHTTPVPSWPKEQVAYMRNVLRGDVNLFITDWSREQWGWKKDECKVIYHGVDTEIFKPLPEVTRKPYILTTVNEYSQPSRLWCCNFDIWKEVVRDDLKWKNLGVDPGFSEPAKDIDDLVFHHNEASIFLNTATFSPVPMSVLEAMACGDCVVSMASCEVPNIIKHGYNGFMGKSPQELRQLCLDLLSKPELRKEVGQNARKTIMERFHLSRFTQEWNELLLKTYE